nr:hypothetical protein [Halobium salinum]
MSDESAEAWEYRVLRPPREPAKKEARDPTTEFNELGSDGWKLIETVDYVGGGTKFLVFRRPAEGGDDPDEAEDLDQSEDAEEADDSGSEDGGTAEHDGCEESGEGADE